ncbi:hypothetical protein LCGC14_0442470 [marine sediment metagenome]|uniref:Uncharacterized protein n=1 Tax=marine sediment metagenome TaxID=412755 RepID=A0A0F9T326_9ZZZZ
MSDPYTIVKGKIVEAPGNASESPRWIAKLSDGTTVIGKPSWMGNSGAVALPADESRPMSDWRRLQARISEDHEELVQLSLWIPPWGLVAIAPANRGAYGYFETFVHSFRQNSQGCEALAICWPETDKRGLHIQVRQVRAGGVLEHIRRTGWLPCMIGEQQAITTKKDLGQVVARKQV